MKNVLLTGGTGFVGRQVLKRLLSAGCNVRLVLRRDGLAPAGVEVWRTDDLFAESLPALCDMCTGIDTVIHAAWYTEPGEYLESMTNLHCLTGTLRLGEAAISAGSTRFVGVGTCFEYDLSAGYLRTSTALAPKTLYGAAKVAAFLTLSRMMALESRSFAWCRLFYLFGEGEDERRLVPYLRACLAAGEPAKLTSGRQIRDYLDVGEAGRRIADAALSGVEGPVNICSGVPVTVGDLALRIAEEYGHRDLVHLGARPDAAGDPPCVFGEPTHV
jgi:dTDP-6-deoxy-L-talose 4-dehydrogenase (NAD+)